MSEILWTSLTPTAAFQRLNSSPAGLRSHEVDQARRTHGANVLPTPPSQPSWQLFLDQFRSALIYILLIAVVISFFVGETRDAFVILAVVLLNALIGWRQERQANAAMTSLRQLAIQEVHVLRDDQEYVLPSGEVVVGDVLIISLGDQVPADGRWIETTSLLLNEASLTGESLPVEKQSDPLSPRTRRPDQHNMSWRGTSVVGGHGLLLVTAVGAQTWLGSLVAGLKTTDDPTPFQQKLNGFSQRLAVATLGLGALIFLLGLARQLPLETVFLLSVSMIVSVIPEGLPVVMTVAMTFGIQAMARRQVIIRKLAAVETLGAVTVVATDKTGTLTYGEMVMERAWVDHQLFHLTGRGYEPAGDVFLQDRKVAIREYSGLDLLLRLGALNNDARFSLDEAGRRTAVGDPTELALLVAAEKGGWTKQELNELHPRVGEIPFDFQKKYMATWHQGPDDQRWLVVKGAPQVVLKLCQTVWTAGGSQPLTDPVRARILELYEQFAVEAYRGLAVAMMTRPAATPMSETLPATLTFVGLVGLADALRPEAAGAIATLRRAGIRTVMLTGDYAQTGRAVGERLGLLNGHDSRRALDGAELDQLDPAALAARLQEVRLVTRVTPEQKLRVAATLQRAGHVVAMTGDGVNDVPVLRQADVGIAVGRGSTDAAKEAADVMLVDGNYESITAAIGEGRRIVRNIRRVMFYLLASNFGELVLVIAALVAGWPMPLLPTQIIWLNAVTDPFMGVALAREPQSPTVMQEQPHDPRAPIIAPAVWRRISMTAGVIGSSALVLFIVLQQANRPANEIFALTLTTIALAQWFAALTARSSHWPFWVRLAKNRSMVTSFILVLTMQCAVLYIPALAKLLSVAPLSALDWVWVILAASPVLLVDVGLKWWIRRHYRVTLQLPVHA